jgi:hypothetical protein
MKTFFAVKIWDGSGAAGTAFAVCARRMRHGVNIAAIPKHTNVNLSFSIIPTTFVCVNTEREILLELRAVAPSIPKEIVDGGPTGRSVMWLTLVPGGRSTARSALY